MPSTTVGKDGKSGNQIAEQIGCSHELVRKLKSETCQVSAVDTSASRVTGKDGRSEAAK